MSHADRIVIPMSQHECVSYTKSANVVYQTISPRIVTKSWAAECVTEFPPTSVSITDSWPLSTCRQRVTLGSRSTQWSCMSENLVTPSKTTGSNCYCWRNLRFITPSPIPHCWHPSGQTTISILRCNSSHPRIAVSNRSCRQTHRWQVWKRVTELSGKT